ncbi:MAG: glutathione S-transferase family protein [Cellvibrionaceae bacterium]|nr:glutathione S-transferase family protein [Cellvibrionaceae bacterium]MCV6627382.1 glutathione S-transferase family protein [Cellvibrionaceae bacterium]
MAKHYRIFGAEMSPYSVKVRAYCRYKNLPHQWLIRNEHNQAEYQRHAKLPIIPLVLDEEDQALQDSTPIIETLEQAHPDTTIYPQNPALKFISQLLEEFADEWGNKWMFHYRWAREVDQIASSRRLALMMKPSASEEENNQMAEMVRQHMVGRVFFVGSNDNNAALIEGSFLEAIEQLNKHLAERPYLMGGRPSLADFGLWGQLYCTWTDPTTGALIEARTPHLMDWIQRMLWPRIEGEFESWEQLAPTLLEFLKQQVGAHFLPWSAANAAAINAGQEEFSVQLGDGNWQQKPQKYHAKSLLALRTKYQAVADKTELDNILGSADCLTILSNV